MNTSVGRQFMAGFIPGILLAVVWSLYIFFICKKYRIVDSKIYTKEEKKKVWK
jgi:C4-dicarboxylate transporter DctM subunit